MTNNDTNEKTPAQTEWRTIKKQPQTAVAETYMDALNDILQDMPIRQRDRIYTALKGAFHDGAEWLEELCEARS